LTAGVHRITWNFRGEAPPRPPLSPSERRDSIQQDRRLTVVVDSMIGAGAERAAVERVAEQIRSGAAGARAFGGGGFGGGAGSRAWIDRPGETPPTEPRAGGGRGGFGGPDAQLMRDMNRLVRGETGFGGGGGFGGGPQAALADPGTYTVHLVLPGRTLTTRLRVERAPGYPSDILPAGGLLQEYDQEGEGR
jgi:hypothetical protein